MDGQPRASEARSFLPPAAFRMLRSHEPPSRPWAPGSRLRRSRLAHSARRLDRGWPARLQRRVPPQPLRRGGVAADAQPAGRGAGPFPRAHRVGPAAGDGAGGDRGRSRLRVARIPAGRRRALRLLRTGLARRRRRVAAPPPRGGAGHDRGRGAHRAARGLPAAAPCPLGDDPTPSPAAVARGLGARAACPALGARRGGAAHDGERRGARAHSAGARLGDAGPATIQPDVLRRARADSCPPRRPAAVWGRWPRGRVSPGLRWRLRTTPSDDTVAVAVLHGRAAHRARRVSAGAHARLPRGGRAVQDRLGKDEGRRHTDAQPHGASAQTHERVTHPMAEPRIKPVTPDKAAPEVQPVFETYLRERGNIPNMFRTVALRPGHLRTMIAHFRTVSNDATVPPLLRTLFARGGTVPSFITVRKWAIIVRRWPGRRATVRNMLGILPRSRRYVSKTGCTSGAALSGVTGLIRGSAIGCVTRSCVCALAPCR